MNENPPQAQILRSTSSNRVYKQHTAIPRQTVREKKNYKTAQLTKSSAFSQNECAREVLGGEGKAKKIIWIMKIHDNKQ